jgi:hypothetical protein
MKQKLNIEALDVQTFTAAPPAGDDGYGVQYNTPSVAFTECYTDCSCPPYW